MVRRETTFKVGGALVVGLGGALIVGLVWAGAGFDYFGAWLGAGISIGMGAFFIYVGQSETTDRLRGEPDPPRRPR
jgi:hypothetical protein